MSVLKDFVPLDFGRVPEMTADELRVHLAGDWTALKEIINHVGHSDEYKERRDADGIRATQDEDLREGERAKRTAAAAGAGGKRLEPNIVA